MLRSKNPFFMPQFPQACDTEKQAFYPTNTSIWLVFDTIWHKPIAATLCQFVFFFQNSQKIFSTVSYCNILLFYILVNFFHVLWKNGHPASLNRYEQEKTHSISRSDYRERAEMRLPKLEADYANNH